MSKTRSAKIPQLLSLSVFESYDLLKCGRLSIVDYLLETFSMEALFNAIKEVGAIQPGVYKRKVAQVYVH